MLRLRRGPSPPRLARSAASSRSGSTHGGSAPDIAVAIAVAALAACAGLEDERGVLYSDLVRFALGDAARIALEELMATRSYQFQSDFARKHEAHGRAEALLMMLESRSLPISDAERQRILSCSDPDIVKGWIQRAFTATCVREILEG